MADIGGTHARLARWSSTSGLNSQVRFSNDEVAGPTRLLEEWMREGPAGERQLLLALAMPVGSDATMLTNRAWRFEPEAIFDALKLSALVIVNDFVAAAAGVDALSPEELFPINGPAVTNGRTARLVVGPGTGLGAAAILSGEPPRVLASEAGHMSLAPCDEFCERLVVDGRKRWGRVSWERALSGDGLAWIDEVLLERGQPATPVDVARRAEAGDPAALAAVKAFSRLLGAFAGDMCLAVQALDGVYLCGGVLNGVRASFDVEEFLAAFADKGRFAEQLGRVPCFLAAAHELGLKGAARFLNGECQMPARQWAA